MRRSAAGSVSAKQTAAAGWRGVTSFSPSPGRPPTVLQAEAASATTGTAAQILNRVPIELFINHHPFPKIPEAFGVLPRNLGSRAGRVDAPSREAEPDRQREEEEQPPVTFDKGEGGSERGGHAKASASSARRRRAHQP